MVAPEFGDLTLRRFKSDVGIGVRFHGPRRHAAAHRAGEGPRRAAPGLRRERGVLTMRRSTIGRVAHATAIGLAGVARRRRCSPAPDRRAAAPGSSTTIRSRASRRRRTPPRSQAWDIDLVDRSRRSTCSASPGDQTPDVRAGNVNTIDEVPDSSWFTNRIGARPVSIDEAVRGPLTGDGPVARRAGR